MGTKKKDLFFILTWIRRNQTRKNFTQRRKDAENSQRFFLYVPFATLRLCVRVSYFFCKDFTITKLRLIGTLLIVFIFFVQSSNRAAQERDTEKHEGETKQEEKHDKHKKGGHHSSRLTDEKIPLMKLDEMPKRPKPILELGEPFLGTGTLKKGIKLPTGAVWQPAFLLFGTYRTGIQSFDTGRDQISEWANRFDLFGNLYLTFTERILIGFRPFDQDGQFTGYTFQPEELRSGFQDEFNRTITTLFFEGDLGEIFPFLDKKDKRSFDFGISVGRQLINFQEGLLINDNIDAVGLTKINLKLPSAVNFRYTLLYAWNQLNRTNVSRANAEDNSASLFGVLTETDWRASTVAFDAIYVNADAATGDGIYGGLSAVQRWGRYNTSFRVVGSFPIGGETAQNSQGVLLMSEISWTPHGNHNLFYLNSFWGIDQFRSAARDPATGGPLGRTGILYAAAGLGRSGAALSNQADEAFGGSFGYQMFFAHTRRQLILEAGGRYATDETGQRAFAAGARYQLAFGRHGVIALDSFASYELGRTALTNDNEFRFGGRLELVIKL